MRYKHQVKKIKYIIIKTILHIIQIQKVIIQKIKIRTKILILLRTKKIQIKIL